MDASSGPPVACAGGLLCAYPTPSCDAGTVLSRLCPRPPSPPRCRESQDRRVFALRRVGTRCGLFIGCLLRQRLLRQTGESDVAEREHREHTVTSRRGEARRGRAPSRHGGAERGTQRPRRPHKRKASGIRRATPSARTFTAAGRRRTVRHCFRLGGAATAAVDEVLMYEHAAGVATQIEGAVLLVSQELSRLLARYE